MAVTLETHLAKLDPHMETQDIEMAVNPCMDFLDWGIMILKQKAFQRRNTKR